MLSSHATSFRGCTAPLSRGGRSSVLPVVMGLLGASLLSSCTSLPRFSPPGEQLPPLTAQGVCERLMQQRNSVRSFRALTEATFTHGDESVSFRYAIVRREPDALRIDMLPLEGAFTLGILVSEGGAVTLLNAQEKSFVEGEDESALLAEFFGIEGLSADLIAGIVTGMLPPLSCADVKIASSPTGTVIIDPSTHTAWSIASTETPSVASVVVLDADGERIKLQAAVREGKSEISLFDPVTARGEITLKKVTLNPLLTPAIFTVRVPESYRRLR